MPSWHSVGAGGGPQKPRSPESGNGGGPQKPRSPESANNKIKSLRFPLVHRFRGINRDRLGIPFGIAKSERDSSMLAAPQTSEYVYRLRFLGHRIEPYAAMTID